MPPPVFRFAPSPNGYLHLGHARSALLNFDLAQSVGGRFLLRIEDIDPARCRPEFEDAIYEDLAWLGLTWEQPARRQSEHFTFYGDALARLDRDGLIYRSFESRAEIARLVAERDARGPWPRDPDGTPHYPGHGTSESFEDQARRIREGLPFAMRLKMEDALRRAGGLTWTENGEGPSGESGTVAARPQDWGDVILGRKETPVSYHLAVVLDDALQDVTHIVRGQDLFYATAIHRLLQVLLDLPQPLYRHHPLVRDERGAKLSKSDRSTAIRALRESGLSARDVRSLCGLPGAAA